MVRNPAVAGLFYESDPDKLTQAIEKCFLGPQGPGSLPQPKAQTDQRVIGLVCPHAGYIYSGSAAAWAYSALAVNGIPDTLVILGPNHYGMGDAVAVGSGKAWETPLGTVETDTDTANEIVTNSHYATESDLAHQKEHSIEVQLPFLQYLRNREFKIVPISIAHLSLHESTLLVRDLGRAISSALTGKNAAIIASTDFSHYVSKSHAQTLDTMAIERIVNLDPIGLLETVNANNISMCGAIGTAVMLEAGKLMGATHANKLAYYTSGDITGDLEQVVGYAALSISL